MEPIRNVFITLEQFAEIQSKYDGVCEYLNGEILFSSRTSRQHNRVVRKILTKLDIYLDGSNCEPFAEQIEVIFKNESEQYNFLPEVFAKTNVMGTVNLLNCAKDAWENQDGVWKEGVKFLHVSTDEVYGSLGDTGYFMETTPLDPHSPYSSSKASSDLMVKAYHDTYKMPINITRCSNNYGPFQFPEKLIPLLINNCLNLKDLPVYGDGLNIRDWLFVEDHAKAIDMVINNGRVGEVYNVGGHNERTNVQIVKTVIGYINENVDSKVTENLIKYVEDRKGHDRRYGIDPTKIKEELGWFPETTFEVGIKKTIKWYLDNKEWMENVTSGAYQKYYEKMYN